MKVSLDFEKFETTAPSNQNALNIFAGRWATNCSAIAPGTSSGLADHFTSDPRPGQASGAIGGLDGKHVLELGPMEGAHTWQLERLGAASVTSVEANAEAYLKCLVVKEISGTVRSHFLYGDMLAYLDSCNRRFDLVFASGVLYHMQDPHRLIKLISNVTDHIFMWTHFVRPDVPSDLHFGNGDLRPTVAIRDGESYTYYTGTYAARTNSSFLGGNADDYAWMQKDQIYDAVRRLGFTSITEHLVEEAHRNGPCVTFSASRENAS